MHDIANEQHALIAGRQDIARMADGVARCRHRLYARYHLLAVLNKRDLLLERKQNFPRAFDKTLDGIVAELALVSPEGEIRLGHENLCIGEIGRACFADQLPAMIRVSMGEDHRVNGIGVNAGGLEIRKKLAAVGTKKMGCSDAGIE